MIPDMANNEESQILCSDATSHLRVASGIALNNPRSHETTHQYIAIRMLPEVNSMQHLAITEFLQ